MSVMCNSRCVLFTGIHAASEGKFSHRFQHRSKPVDGPCYVCGGIYPIEHILICSGGRRVSPTLLNFDAIDTLHESHLSFELFA